MRPISRECPRLNLSPFAEICISKRDLTSTNAAQQSVNLGNLTSVGSLFSRVARSLLTFQKYAYTHHIADDMEFDVAIEPTRRVSRC